MAVNPVPWFLRFVGGWASIKRKVDVVAAERQLPPYSREPKAYRFHEWGTVGVPPRLACNVKYIRVDGVALDLGRIVA